jgi:hypothetical protein
MELTYHFLDEENDLRPDLPMGSVVAAPPGPNEFAAPICAVLSPLGSYDWMDYFSPFMAADW